MHTYIYIEKFIQRHFR